MEEASIHEFFHGTAWKHLRRELIWEIAAVLLPVVGYATVSAFYLIDHNHPGFWDLMGKPDSFFGASILFLFAAIHGFEAKVIPGNELLTSKLHSIKWIGFSLGLICVVVGTLAIVFHGVWAMGVGLLMIWVAVKLYVRSSAYRAYAKQELNDGPH